MSEAEHQTSQIQPTDPTPLDGSYISLDQGWNIWTVEQGTGTPILFIHGIPTSSYLWRNVQRPLSKNYRTIAPDMIGLGKTDIPKGRKPDMSLQVEMLSSLLASLNESSAHIVAHDIGGGVAFMFAEQFPEKVRSLTILNIGALAKYWPVKDIKMLQLPIMGEIGAFFLTKKSLRSQLSAGLYNRKLFTTEISNNYFTYFEKHNGRSKFLQFIRTFNPPRVEQAVSNFPQKNIPLNILWGSKDKFQIVQEARDLKELLNPISYEEIEEAGHFWQEEKPHVLADRIEKFIGAL